MKNYIACLLLTLASYNSIFADDQHALGKVVHVQVGLFTAEGKTPAGEKIYFGFERLDSKKNRLPWQNYAEVCNEIAGENGLLTHLSDVCTNADACETLRKNSAFKKMKKKEYQDLIQALRAQEIYPVTKKWLQLQAIKSTLKAFNPENCSYIAYISTKPITKRVKAHEHIKTPNDLIKAFGHIVMSVGTTLSQEVPVYENRWIFRNPIHLVEGKYKDVSCLLQAFTAKAMKVINHTQGARAMKYLIVHATPRVCDVVVEEAKGKALIGDQIPLELNVNPANDIREDDTAILVDIDDVITICPELEEAPSKSSHKSKHSKNSKTSHKSKKSGKHKSHKNDKSKKSAKKDSNKKSSFHKKKSHKSSDINKKDTNKKKDKSHTKSRK